MTRWAFVLGLVFVLAGCPRPVDSGRSPLCGGGTMLVDGACVARPSPLCLAGTLDVDGGCVGPALATCGSGTTPVDGGCRRAGLRDRYWIQLASTHVLANGYSPYPVAAFGRVGDLPATDLVVITVVPPSAGLVNHPSFTLLSGDPLEGDPLLGVPQLTPCNAYQSPECAGTFELHLARASQPDVTLASTGPLTLDRPAPVSDPAPCLVDGTSVGVVSGTHPRALPLGGTLGLGGPSNWYATGAALIPSFISMSYLVDERTFAAEWRLNVEAPQLWVGVFNVDHDESPGTVTWPHMTLSYESTACPQPRGAFQIHRMDQKPPYVFSEVLVTFDQLCASDGSHLSGCMRFVHP